MVRRPAIHQMITSRKAPKPLGPYAHAVKVTQAGEMLFISGQIPIEAQSGKVLNADIKKQTELVLSHLRNILLDAGFSVDDLVKCTIFLTDLKNFEAVNEVYSKMFVGMNVPARSVVQVAALPKDVPLEIEAIAVKRGKTFEENVSAMEAAAQQNNPNMGM